jgi:CRP/FNR family transcriptional regulator, cyclic AMP receptor protein
MATDAVLLADVGFFKLLDDDERAVLAQQVEHRTIPGGTTIFREGDPGGIMYVIRSGKVELWVYDEDRQRVVLANFEEGDFFGELSLLDQEPRSATATTLTDTEVLIIDRTDLQLLFKQKPDAALDVISVLGNRLRFTSEIVRSRAARNPNEVIEERLTIGDRLADKLAAFGGSWRFIISFGSLLFGWILFNSLTATPIDPFPFILLNLMLSALAAMQAPVIMMSQNRADAKDRIRAELDYRVNVKAETEVAEVHAKIDELRQDLLRAIDLAARYQSANDLS